VEKSNIAKDEESEDGQVQNQGDVDCFLWWKGNCEHIILATGPDHQPAHWQGHPATFEAVSTRGQATNVRKKSWLLHHNYALAHNALIIQEFLAKNNIAVLEQPPYSPHLALCYFSCSL